MMEKYCNWILQLRTAYQNTFYERIIILRTTKTPSCRQKYIKTSACKKRCHTTNLAVEDVSDEASLDLYNSA